MGFGEASWIGHSLGNGLESEWKPLEVEGTEPYYLSPNPIRRNDDKGKGPQTMWSAVMQLLNPKRSERVGT